MITEPGVDKILAENKDKPTIASIKSRVRISVEKHASKVIAIAGHYGCAGNPVNKDKHLQHLERTAGKIAN